MRIYASAMSELRAKIEAAWSAVWQKRTIGGWILFLCSLILHFSDKWDSLNSLIGKIKNMGPFFKFIVDAAQSPIVQLCVFVLGVLWIGIAAVISAKRTGRSYHAVTFQDAVIVPSEHHDGALLLRRQEQAPPDFSDPAYDRFFGLSGWRDGLIKRGQVLVEQWTARLEYPDKQRREHDSKNWLGEVNEFAKKHLTSEQINEFMLHHGMAVSASKKYDFAMALIQAGTQTGSEDGNLAFEILGKVKFLERFRSEPNKTPIELIGDAIKEGEKIERFCEGFNDGAECQERVNVWLENTKASLRASAADYFAMFYEAVEKQYTGPLCPHPDPQHPKEMIAVSKWYADKQRLKAWQMIRKCLDALRSIKSKLRATLPS